MKVIAIIATALALAACGGPLDHYHVAATMVNLRSHTGTGQYCKTQYRWLECDRHMTPSEVYGGGE